MIFTNFLFYTVILWKITSTILLLFSINFASNDQLAMLSGYLNLDFYSHPMA